MKLSGFTIGLLIVAAIAAAYTLYDYTLGQGGDLYEVGFIVVALVLAAVSHFAGRRSLNDRNRP